MEPRRAALVALGLAAAIAGRAHGQQLFDPNLELETLATGLDLPVTLALLSPNEILFVEKNSGRVRRIENGVLQPQAAVDVNVNGIGDRGLIGIVVNRLDPPWVFLYYTEGEGADGGTPLGNRVYRYVWNDATKLLESPQLILDLPVGATITNNIHNGGIMTFGPTGVVPGVGDGALLHVAIGDLNRDGQLQNFSLGPLPDDSGVILRVNQNGGAAPGNPLLPYCSNDPAQTCASSPQCGAGTCQLAVTRYFAYGIRNAFGLAIDPWTGLLWDTENGPESFDEVNRVPAGMNSGWERVMGPVSRDAEGLVDLFVIPGSSYHDPEFSFLMPIGITSIVFPLGSTLGPDYDQRALVGEANAGQLYSLPLNGARTAFDFSAIPVLQDLVVDDASEDDPIVIGESLGVITDLEIGPDLDLYMVSHDQAKIFRVSGPRSAVPSAPFGARLVLAALALGLALGVRRRAHARDGRPG
jgi:glucose/arabinose dehydrogenase